MTEGPRPPPPPPKATLPTISDIRFGFLTQDWLNPHESVFNSLKTAEEQYRLLADDDAYRQTVSPTTWSRYVHLGRPTTTGFHFDKIWNNFDSDPSLLYQLIWYTYLYYVDRELEIPMKLEHWATTVVQPYLASHSPQTLLVDTLQTTWSMIENKHEPWIHVGSNKRPASTMQEKSGKVIDRLDSNRTPVQPKPTLPTNIPPIPEESEDDPELEKTPTTDNISQTSSDDAKQSALIPNLKVSMNDGTHRVTFRMKQKIDVNNIEKATTEIHHTIQELLAAVFSEDDGYMYRWSRDELTDPKVVSDMSLSQLRSYMPKINIMPTQAMVIFSVRFGFTDLNPTNWRNKILTKEILQDFQTTVSTSNSKSTSGRLVVAGYVLLKSPNLTHRIRYLQSLRSNLPENTPGFDILLHRRTPTDQKIDHLAIQCGENHVHPLSNALLNVLDGKKAGVYVPRFAFSTMTTTEVSDIFLKHDNYVKTQKMIPLSPFITNLDTVRCEHRNNPIERTTRQWAYSLNTEDGKSMKCDVVNGGYDQKAYILVPPQHEEMARSALEEYKTMIFPFAQREARFRESIGPPSVILFSTKIKASLEVFDSISSSEFWQKAPKTVRHENSEHTQDEQSYEEHSSMSSSNTNKWSKAPTKDKSRSSFINSQSRQLSPQDNINKDTQLEGLTTATNSTKSGFTSAMESGFQSRFRELEALIKMQQEEIEKSATLTTKSNRQMAQQLKRLDSVDDRLLKQEEKFVDLEDKMVKSLDRQLDLGTNMLQMRDQFQQQLDMLMTAVTNLAEQRAVIPTARQLTTVTDMDAIDHHSTKSASTSSQKTEHSGSQGKVHSPEKKKQRATSDDVFFSPTNSSDDTSMRSEDGSKENTSSHQSTTSYDSHISMENLEEISTTLESRYKENAPGSGHEP